MQSALDGSSLHQFEEKENRADSKSIPDQSTKIRLGRTPKKRLDLVVLSRGFAYCRRPPNRDGPTERSPTEEVPELRNSEISDFRQNRRKTNFLRGFLKNPSVESVLGEHTQLFTEGFPVIFHEGLFSSWKRFFLADFKCRFRTRSPMFAFGWLVVAWECLERTFGVLGLSVPAVIA